MKNSAWRKTNLTNLDTFCRGFERQWIKRVLRSAMEEAILAFSAVEHSGQDGMVLSKLNRGSSD